MFESIQSLIAGNQAILFGLISIVLLIAILSKASAQLWVRDFWVRFPMIGTIARLSKDTTAGNNGWLRSEQKLAALYRPFVTLLPEAKFKDRIEYMRKAGDLGRTPMPIWVVLLLSLLVVAEGLGFSYMLGTWMAREGSENTHNLLMVAIVFVLATILVVLTHAAGHQYYRTSLLRGCFKKFKNHEGRSFSSRNIALNEDQSIDDHEPDYVQTVNRVAKHSGDKGSYAACWIAIISIAIIAIASTVMRMQALDRELTESVAGGKVAHSQTADPFENLDLPAEVVAPQAAADAKAHEESVSSTRVEGMSAFIMLGFIFVVTQIVGMGAGYKYGFAGRETYKKVPGTWLQKDGAYADTEGISTYDTYWQMREPLMDLANARLKDLQQRMEADSHEKLSLKKTFHDYLNDTNTENAAVRARINATSVSSAAASHSVANHHADPVEEAKAAIEALTDKEAQINHFLSLPANIQEAIKPWLAERKKKAESQSREAVEGLF